MHFARNFDDKVKVRLCAEEERFPDAQLKVGRAHMNIEITEVIEKWRKRGDEFKMSKRKSELFPYDLDRESRSGKSKEKILINFIDEIVRKKISKYYDKRSKTHLVVLCNIYLWGEHNNIFGDYRHLFSAYLNDFATISILSSDGKQLTIYDKLGVTFL